MPNDAKEMEKEAIRYLGKYDSFLRTLKKEDWNWFKSFHTSHHKSYIVKGTAEKLNKFKALFLGMAVFDKPIYKEFQLMDYVKKVSFDKEREYEYDCDLLILYSHNKLLGVGNTEAWAITNLIEKVAERNRMGLATLVLSERNFDELEKSQELEIVDLGGWTSVISRQEYIKEGVKKAMEKGEEAQTLTNNGDKANTPVNDSDISY